MFLTVGPQKGFKLTAYRLPSKKQSVWHHANATFNLQPDLSALPQLRSLFSH